MNSNAYMNTYMKERYRKRRSEAITKLGGKCAKCESTKDLQFHHKDPSQKSFTLAHKPSSSQQEWDEEIAKCELLCKDCHIAEHKSKAPCGTAARYWRGCRCDRCTKAHSEHVRSYRARRRALREQSRR